MCVSCRQKECRVGEETVQGGGGDNYVGLSIIKSAAQTQHRPFVWYSTEEDWEVKIYKLQ